MSAFDMYHDFGRNPYIKKTRKPQYAPPTLRQRLERAQDRIRQLELENRNERRCHEKALRQRDEARNALKIKAAEVDRLQAKLNADRFRSHVTITAESYRELTSRVALSPGDTVINRDALQRLRTAAVSLANIKRALR